MAWPGGLREAWPGSVWPGRQGAVDQCKFRRGRLGVVGPGGILGAGGLGRPCSAMHAEGSLWLGLAGQARRGEPRISLARRCRHGSAQLVVARPGEARQASCRRATHARRGSAGEVLQRSARQGTARQVWFAECSSGQGEAGGAELGKPQHGQAWQVAHVRAALRPVRQARQGKEGVVRRGRQGKALIVRPGRHGGVRHSADVHGGARQVWLALHRLGAVRYGRHRIAWSLRSRWGAVRQVRRGQLR